MGDQQREGGGDMYSESGQLRNTMAVFYKQYQDQNFDKESDSKNQLMDKFMTETLNRKNKGIFLVNELWSNSFHQQVMGQSKLQQLISKQADERINSIQRSQMKQQRGNLLQPIHSESKIKLNQEQNYMLDDRQPEDPMNRGVFPGIQTSRQPTGYQPHSQQQPIHHERSASQPMAYQDPVTLEKDQIKKSLLMVNKVHDHSQQKMLNKLDTMNIKKFDQEKQNKQKFTKLTQIDKTTEINQYPLINSFIQERQHSKQRSRVSQSLEVNTQKIKEIINNCQNQLQNKIRFPHQEINKYSYHDLRKKQYRVDRQNDVVQEQLHLYFDSTKRRPKQKKG